MPQPSAMQQVGGAPAPPEFRPQVVRSVRMHPQIAAGVAAVVFVLLAGFALTRRATYVAESLVYEEPAVPKLLSDGSAGFFDPNRYDSYLQQQMQEIVRPDVLNAALASLPASTWSELGSTQQAAMTNLAAQLKIARVTTSYQLSISLQGTNASNTAAIVNAVTSAYIDAVHKVASVQTDQRVQLLSEERTRIEAELETTRAEQSGLSAALGVASPLGETGNPYDFELASLRQQLLTARQAHDVSAAQLGVVSGEGAARSTALSTAADEIINSDSGLSNMRASVAVRRSTLNGQMAGMKPDNPVYKQNLDELTDLDKSLDKMTTQLRGKAERQLQEKLKTDLERTGDIEARLNGQLRELTAKATSAAPKLQRASELAGDLTRLNTRYGAVDDTLRSLQLEANGPGVVRLSLAAAVPATPEPSRKKLILLAAPLLALIFGALAAVIARKRDHHVYSGHDLEDLLGFPPMAILPARADVSARVLEEYVLRLAAGIESAYRSSGAKTFLLTAVSASTDIRQLRNALTGKLERIGLDVAVARTTDLMVAGPELTEDSRLELIKIEGAGDGFVAVHLAKLKASHSIVVIDAPALGTSAETEYVARCADATILIAESGVTTREELMNSAKLLERLHARGIGLVLQEMHLRYAETSFRQAIDAFEQRQPDRSLSKERSTSYPMPRREEPPVEAVAESSVEPVFESADEHVVPTVVAPVEVNSVEAAHFETAHFEAAPVEADHIAESHFEPAHVEEATAQEAWVESVHVEDQPVEVAHLEAAPVEAAQAEEEPTAEEDLVMPVGFRHRGMRSVATITEIKPVPRTPAANPRNHVEFAVNSRNGSSREKMAPTFSAKRGQASDGETPMSGSKNWFQRLLRRDESKVSIVPDGDDESGQVNASDFLNSRISRSIQAYDLPQTKLETVAPAVEPLVEHVAEPVVEHIEHIAEPVAEHVAEPVAEHVAEPVRALFTEPEEAEKSYSRRFVLEDLHPHENAVAEVEHAFEDHDPPVHEAAAEPEHVAEIAAPAAHVAYDESHSDHFRIPLEMIEPWIAREPEEEEAPAYVAEQVREPLPEPVAKPRPARPLSFHELAGMNHEEVHAAPIAEREYTDVIAEWTHPEEEVAYAPFEAVHEFHAEPVTAAAPVIEEPVPVHEVVAHVEPEPEPVAVAAPVVEPVAPPRRDPYAAPARDPYAPPPGTSRWDPIPPLRPSDSGWDRIYGVPAAPIEQTRHSEDWNWTTRDGRPEQASPRWEDEAPAEEFEEPALSRPWGLLSRFQQTNQIAPARKPVAPSSSDESRDTGRPGSFQSYRKG